MCLPLPSLHVYTVLHVPKNTLDTHLAKDLITVVCVVMRKEDQVHRIILSYFSTAANIFLASDVFHIEERRGLQRFPIIRNGSISGVNKVLCKLKPVNATPQIIDEARADFYVPGQPETVTFKPFNTTECKSYTLTVITHTCYIYTAWVGFD